MRVLKRRLCLGLRGALCAMGLIGLLQSPARAQDDPDAPASIVLWNLPPKDSPEYKYLRDIGGVLGGEALNRSGAEMWLLNPNRAEMLRHAAGEQGVRVVELGKRFNELMTGIRARVEATEFPADPGPFKAFMQKVMKSRAVRAVTMMTVKPPALIEYALARGEQETIGHWKAPESVKDEIVIQISDTEKITVKRTHLETHDDRCVWYGLIEGSGLPVSLIWWRGGRMTGSFAYRDKMYVIKSLEGALHAVVEMNPDDLPPEHPEMDMSMPGEMSPRIERRPGMEPGVRGIFARAKPLIQRLKRRWRGEDQSHLADAPERAERLPPEFAKLLEEQPPPLAPGANASTPVVITVLFLYTQAAARNYTDIDKDLIALAVEQTNQSFRLSKIGNVRIEIAGTAQTDYDESGANLYNHLWRLADRGDGYLEEIHKLRDEKKADIVVLIVDSPNGCGLATRVGAESDEAFAVVHHECATTTFSVAHEIGHLIGARHDRSLDTSTRPYPFGHGYVNGDKWRTMMAYKSACNGCPRLPIWSNPDVLVGGEPAGDAMTNNARVLADQAARVAAFR